MPSLTGMSKSKPNKAVKWSVPRWSRAREFKRIVPSIFGIAPVTRIVGISLFIAAVLCISFKIAIPQMQFDFLWQALLAIPAMFVYLAIMLCLDCFLPGQVKLNAIAITYSNGRITGRTLISDIEKARFVVFSDEHLLLRLYLRGKSKKIPIPPTLDLEELAALLPAIEIVDARGRFQRVRKLLEQTSHTRK